MESCLNKGINKIIEEYCYYPRVFEEELHKITTAVLKDTETWWVYDKYFVGLDNKNFKIKGWNCFYLNTYYGWIINEERI